MNTMELNDSIKDYYRLLMASKNEKSVKQKNRYDVVLLYMEGYSRKKISEILHIPLRTVSYHILSYEKGGMESLLIVKQPGAQKKLTDKQETELLSVISTQTPKEVGLGVFANWTAALACAFVKQKFGISYSSRGMLNLFDRLGLSYTRPTYTLDKADPKKQEQFRKTFETLKKLLEGDITTILFEDESMIRDYQAIMKTWFPKGKQRIIPTYGKHEGVKLVGFLDYETGHVYVEEHKKYDAEVFLQFLKNVLSQYPNGKTVIILDNARIHHAKLLKEFLDKNKDCLEPVYLPPYSPNLNKIEELWGWLKDSVINNVFFHSREEIQKAVQKFIDWVTTVPQMVIERLCL